MNEIKNLGKLITVEGVEGAGKSTALKFIKSFLQKSVRNILLTREPGGTSIGIKIRQILLHTTALDIRPMTELLLMFADRAQHIEQCILPALQQGQWVVSDRYVDASYAYQGGGRGIKEQYIETLDKMIVGKVRPHLTLLLDLPVELGFSRLEKSQRPKDRIEQEQMKFFKSIRKVYLARAKEDPDRIKIIDASQTIEGVEIEIKGILKTFLQSNLKQVTDLS